MAGAAAAVVVLLAGVVAVGAIRNPTATMPANPSTYGGRTATIDGITVTAPSGWTLIDDLPMARILPATSESCSLHGDRGSRGRSRRESGRLGRSGDPGSQPQQSCSTSPVAMPAGIPVLQLANFELPPVGFVCDVADIDRTSIPSDGVVAYVAEFPNGIKTGDFDGMCPGSEEIVTFADSNVTTVYAAVSVVGTNASAEDAAVAREFINLLGGMRIVPSEPSTAGPAYVVAAGDDGGTPWRLEAGFTSIGSTDQPIGTMLVTTAPDGRETSESAPPSTQLVDRATELGDGTWLQWGTAPASVTEVTSVTPDGTRSEATVVAWPDGLRSFTDAVELDGSIWYTIVPVPGSLETTPSGASRSGSPASRRPADDARLQRLPAERAPGAAAPGASRSCPVAVVPVGALTQIELTGSDRNRSATRSRCSRSRAEARPGWPRRRSR